MEDKVVRFRVFFDRNYPKVKTFAFRLLKSEEDAEDVAQDIFVKLWERPELWMERNGMDSYLYTVVRNNLYNFLKHRCVENNYMETASEWMKMSPPEHPRPDDEMELRELELQIMMSVERMPEQRRRVFIMSRKYGMSNKEIAEKLGLSVRTVEQHLYKALQDLKKTIVFCIFLFLG